MILPMSKTKHTLSQTKPYIEIKRVNTEY